MKGVDAMMTYLMLSKRLEASLYNLMCLGLPLRTLRKAPTPPLKPSVCAALQPAGGGAGARDEGHEHMMLQSLHSNLHHCSNLQSWLNFHTHELV